MARIFRSNMLKIPQRHRDENNAGLHDKGILLCPYCQNVNYKKSWHELGKTSQFYKGEISRKLIKKVVCPACQMEKNGLYEGRVSIQHVPEEMYLEILRLISAYGERAYVRDPQHRIIKIVDSRDTIEVTTTENQLAIKLAKKIKETFKKFKLRVLHSKEPFEVEYAELKIA